MQEVQGTRPLLDARGLVRTFGGVKAVDGVSFEVRAGEVAGLIGPNGAGKSTVLDLVAGALRPESGSIRFDGNEVTGLAPHQLARRGIIRTFQNARGFSNLTVMENLLTAASRPRGDSLGGALLGPRWWRSDQRRLVAEARVLLDRFDMRRMEDTYAKSLSGGQRRLVDIMRALMAKPSLLLLDEPMAGVNLGLAERIGQHLLSLRADGITILMVEHVFELLNSVCDRVIVLAQGRVIGTGGLTEVRASPAVQEAYVVG
ncbi:MAG: ABC transporter ATP-binding protein [Candidatus Dormibacteraeota bacterium]|nr:ABC transporter ATP-binding protein [Candidatus Dormibacteraeota bacterium]